MRVTRREKGSSILRSLTIIELVETYGDPTGQRIYSDRGDLLSLYRGKHAEREWNRS